MLKSVARVYRNGQIELTEAPEQVPDETRVIVTSMMSEPKLYDSSF